MWYSQQAEEGEALGFPLGSGPYGEANNGRPVKVMGNDEEEDSTGDEEEGVAVDRDGWGVPLYGRMRE